MIGASQGPLVRPWALAVPVLVVLICLPFLRPLRSPDPRIISDDETLRLATMAALVETGSPAIIPPEGRPTPPRGTGLIMAAADGRFYSAQPPMLAAMMALAYWPMHASGLPLATNPSLVPYLLTIIFATLPVAAVAGMTYRLGRLMALRRLYRTLLALMAVTASGLLAYGTYINPMAPAAALLMLAVACVVHLVSTAPPTDTTAPDQRQSHDGGWLLLAGLAAGTAACIIPTLAVPALSIGILIFCIRWSRAWRAIGLILFLVGFAPPLAADAILTADAPLQLSRLVAPPDAPVRIPTVDDEDFGESRSLAIVVAGAIGQLAIVTAGPFGPLSHVPLTAVGIAGCFIALRRNWPAPTKSLAGITMGSVIWCIAAEALVTPWRNEHPFGPAGSAAVLPLAVLMTGVILHSRWRPSWVVVILILSTLSSTVALMGAGCPMLRGGYQTYSVYEAWTRITTD